MIYDIDFFIDKFSKIPDREWAVKAWKNFIGQKCAIGHCLNNSVIERLELAGAEDGVSSYKISKEEKETDFKEAFELCKLFDSKSARNGSGFVININNGDDPRYQQSTPKKRILAALYDIKKMQHKDIDTGGKVKERIVYVAVPETITEQAKELITN